MENIESLLLQVDEIIKKYDEFNKKTGKNFNIFSIIDKSELELAHEKFMGELLNSKGSHNQGDKFLKLFLNILGIKHKLKNPRVILEKVIDENRRIDIVIEDENFIVAIEMKVNAKDQENQLYDYYHHLKKSNKKFYLYYLTPDGRDAGENSTKNLKEGKDYYLISFQNEIYIWIKNCIKESCEIPILREAINQYKLLLEKIFNLAKDKKEEVMDKIEKNIKAAHEIYNNYVEVWAKKEYEFWIELFNYIYKHCKNCEDNDNKKNKYSYDIRIYKDGEIDKGESINKIKNYISNSKIRGISFSKKINNKTIYVGIEYYNNSENIYFWVNNNIKIPKEIELYEGEEDTYLKDVSANLKFFKSDNPTFELFDEKEFKKLIRKVGNEFINFVRQIEQKNF